MKSEKSGCIICGEPLLYRTHAENASCELCGEQFDTTAWCERGHFVCDACHAGGAITVARSLCLRRESADPWELALEIMRQPYVNMHGPEHHIIVGFALATAYCTAHDRRDGLAGMLGAIEERARNIPGGTCGYWGACGSALGAGVFLSVTLDANPLGGGALCNKLTARCLDAIATVSEVRCCKRNMGITLGEAVVFLREQGLATLSLPQIACEFTARNQECIGKSCSFFTA